MSDFHGIIFAYSASPELRELVSHRTAASLPFCGRYRLIDFALSSMMNAGVRDVGVIMQRDYQSLLDHVGSGKAWDMSLKNGGLRILPPFGLPEYHKGNYSGTMEALNAVASYIRDIPQKHIVMMLGNVCANVDLAAAMQQHVKSGLPVTAICTAAHPAFDHHSYITDENGDACDIIYGTGSDESAASLEAYIIEKDTLLEMMARCRASNLYRFHQDGITVYLRNGGKMGIYMHRGYAAAIRSVDDYFKASSDVLRGEVRRSLFPKDRPVRTRNLEGVSTYYGEKAVSRNSLVADNCIIEGELDNCIVFPGVRVSEGAVIKNSVIMNGCVIEKGAKLECVIADKNCIVSGGTELKGNEKLPVVMPKGSSI